jgi:hypothetical protein
MPIPCRCCGSDAAGRSCGWRGRLHLLPWRVMTPGSAGEKCGLWLAGCVTRIECVCQVFHIGVFETTRCEPTRGNTKTRGRRGRTTSVTREEHRTIVVLVMVAAQKNGIPPELERFKEKVRRQALFLVPLPLHFSPAASTETFCRMCLCVCATPPAQDGGCISRAVDSAAWAAKGAQCCSGGGCDGRCYRRRRGCSCATGRGGHSTGLAGVA